MVEVELFYCLMDPPNDVSYDFLCSCITCFLLWDFCFQVERISAALTLLGETLNMTLLWFLICTIYNILLQQQTVLLSFWEATKKCMSYHKHNYVL